MSCMTTPQPDFASELFAQLPDLEPGAAAERVEEAFGSHAAAGPVVLSPEAVDSLLSHPESEVLLGLLPPGLVAAVAENLLERLSRDESVESDRAAVWHLLDAVRDRSFRRRLTEPTERREWADTITRLVNGEHANA